MFWRKWGTTIDFQKLKLFPFFICFFRKKARKKQPAYSPIIKLEFRAAYSPIIKLEFRHPRRKKRKKGKKVDLLVSLYKRRRAGRAQRPQKNTK